MRAHSRSSSTTDAPTSRSSPTRRTMCSRLVVLPTPPVSNLHHGQPQQEADDRREVREADEPVASVGDRWHQVFACESSHRARLVKPIITASIQYCERTASLALS